MPYCSQCGSQVPESATFCQHCGQPQPSLASAAPQAGLSPSTAALLSYVLGWFTGLIFFLIDKRPYVRFHAAQSIVTFGGLHIIRVVLGMALGVGWWFGGRPTLGGGMVGLPALAALGILTFVLWIVLMIKAYQGERFKLPIAGDLAEDFAGR